MENSSAALQDLAHMFFDYAEDPTYGIEHLNVRELDFSVDSLLHVNEYLKKTRSSELSDEDNYVVCLRAGAYLGEVIRKNDPAQCWQWLSYDQGVAVNQEVFKELGQSMGTLAVLCSSGGRFVFPLAKIQKYLINGNEDDTTFFALAVIGQAGL